MKSAVIYSTMTGHSKKIAKAIGKQTNIGVYDVKDKPSFKGYDMIFIVSGIYANKARQELIEYTKFLTEDNTKKITLITSSTSGMKQNDIRAVFEKNGIPVNKEEYICKGGFLFRDRGRPNADDINGVIDFVNAIIEEKKNI